MEALDKVETVDQIDSFLSRELDTMLSSTPIEQLPDWDMWEGSIFEELSFEEEHESYQGLGFI